MSVQTVGAVESHEQAWKGRSDTNTNTRGEKLLAARLTDIASDREQVPGNVNSRLAQWARSVL